MTTHHKDVAIVGAGPAGLMAAQQLATKGIHVTVFDGMPTPARKFLMAGRGGLNLTHSEPLETFLNRYRSSAPQLKPIINAFPPSELIAWAHSLGQETFIGSSGRVFPKSLKTSPLLRAWMKRLNELGVTFCFRHNWLGWEPNTYHPSPLHDKQTLMFTDVSNNKVSFKVDATILALGGASWPKLGADGRWVPILKTNDIAITPLTPFNAGVIIPWSQTIKENFAGHALKRISLTVGKETSFGEAMITKNGLEGGVVYHLNTAIKQTLTQNKITTLTVDLRPDLTLQTLEMRLKKPRKTQSTSTFLRKTVRLSKPAIAILREPMQGNLPTDARTLAHCIKHTPLILIQLSAIDRAISSSGGIKEEELDENAMLKQRPGVFIAGEMRDWDAPTGGYLLQATFATAVQAAKGTLKWLNNEVMPTEKEM